jgi:hypothetical protein
VAAQQNLSDSERGQCNKLWSEVAALLKQAGEGGNK